MASLYYNGAPFVYGAIMYNGNSAAIASCYPFFTSQSNLATLTSISNSGAGTISVADVDDYWTVMPGYKIVLYDGSGYTGSTVTYDNTSGIVPINYKPATANIVTSFQLYFNNVLV